MHEKQYQKSLIYINITNKGDKMIKKIVTALRMFRALRTVYAVGTPPVLELKSAVLTLRELGVSDSDPRYREAQRVLLANAMAHKAYWLAYSTERIISMNLIEPYPDEWKLNNLDYSCICGWGEQKKRTDDGEMK